MIIDIIGGPKSAKSTIGAGISRLIADIRHSGAAGVCTEVTSAIALQEHGIAEIARVRSLRGAQRAIQAQGGNVVVLDTTTKLYERALRTYRETANEFRLREGADPDANIPPAGWQVINERYYDSTVGAAIAAGVDLIQIHREGSVYSYDPVLGNVETEGTRTRGAAEAGAHGHLSLMLYGGIRSRHKRVGDRWLFVANDPAGLATGRVRALEDIRGLKDRAALQTMLDGLLRGSLEAVIKATDADRAEWQALDEPEDDFGEARADADRSESHIILDGYRRLFRLHNIDGQSREERGIRAGVLQEAIGAETLETAEVMYERKPRVLEAGLEVVRQRLERLAADKAFAAREAQKAEVARLEENLRQSVEVASKPRTRRNKAPKPEEKP